MPISLWSIIKINSRNKWKQLYLFSSILVALQLFYLQHAILFFLPKVPTTNKTCGWVETERCPSTSKICSKCLGNFPLPSRWFLITDAQSCQLPGRRPPQTMQLWLFHGGVPAGEWISRRQGINYEKLRIRGLTVQSLTMLFYPLFFNSQHCL